MAKKGKKGHQAAAARAAKAKAEESTAPAGDARKGVKGLLVAEKMLPKSIQLRPLNYIDTSLITHRYVYIYIYTFMFCDLWIDYDV